MNNQKLIFTLLSCILLIACTTTVSAQLKDIPDPDRKLDRLTDDMNDVKDDLQDVDFRDIHEQERSNEELQDMIDKFDLMEEDIAEYLGKITKVKNIDLWDNADNITLSELRVIDDKLDNIKMYGQELVNLRESAIKIAEDLVFEFEEGDVQESDMDSKDSKSKEEEDTKEEQEAREKKERYLIKMKEKLEMINDDAQGVQEKIEEEVDLLNDIIKE